MKLLMYGVNRETVMKEDTIKYALNHQKKKTQMTDISKFEGVKEIAVLTNDFRNEYYLYVDETVFSHGEFLRYLADATDKTLQEIILETYSKFNEDVLRHLFEVASGYLADPKGAFSVLGSVEEAIIFAETLDTSGEVLYRMFQNAIYLAYDLKLEETVKPLNRSRLSNYIYLLKEQMNGLAKKNYLISGNDLEVYYLTRLLLFAGARTISIIQENEAETKRQFEKIEAFLSGAERTKVYPVTAKSLYYRLSKIDGAILDTNQLNLFTQEIREEVSLIRQTRKLQYLIDTTEDAQLDIDFPELDLYYMNGAVEVTFNEEEQENAMVVFEEKLSIQIKQFMEYLENLQVNKVKEKLL